MLRHPSVFPDGSPVFLILLALRLYFDWITLKCGPSVSTDQALAVVATWPSIAFVAHVLLLVWFGCRDLDEPVVEPLLGMAHCIL